MIHSIPKCDVCGKEYKYDTEEVDIETRSVTQMLIPQCSCHVPAASPWMPMSEFSIDCEDRCLFLRSDGIVFFLEFDDLWEHTNHAKLSFKMFALVNPPKGA